MAVGEGGGYNAGGAAVAVPEEVDGVEVVVPVPESVRGYAVLSVNYRSSTGFGPDFINAGNLEWGGKMHDGLLDAVQRAIDEGIADPQRVAIMGGSYGGYATLWD